MAAGAAGGSLSCTGIEIIQVNLGLYCNQKCAHCHVGASPERTEKMSWETMELVLDAADEARPRLVDITGGAPELHPEFRRFVVSLRADGHRVQVRTNLTALLEPGLADIPDFLRRHGVGLVASMPCYLEENVAAQRGGGVYRKSVDALRRLNAVGFGTLEGLALDLVYNPVGPFLPPDQSALETDYRRELDSRFGISFTRLITIANMPIGRFWDDMKRAHKDDGYMRLLVESFNPATLGGLMCRHQVSVGWDGRMYDCDFNLALGLPVGMDVPDGIEDFDLDALACRKIVTGAHCFGCTAGCGSSCRGALV
ncbi:MAG TPA: arsenosugar biosynthesis radical SAM (seleno)protein ArsS [Nitrospirota bacterium]